MTLKAPLRYSMIGKSESISGLVPCGLWCKISEILLSHFALTKAHKQV